MSFVPAPQQANAASAKNNSNVVASSTTANAGSGDAANDQDVMFKIRTFDVQWVDRSALMYKDGFAKVRVARFGIGYVV